MMIPKDVETTSHTIRLVQFDGGRIFVSKHDLTEFEMELQHGDVATVRCTLTRQELQEVGEAIRALLEHGLDSRRGP